MAETAPCPHCGITFPLLPSGKVIPHARQVRQGRCRPRKTVTCPPRSTR